MPNIALTRLVSIVIPSRSYMYMYMNAYTSLED